MAGAEGLEVASQPLLRCPKKSSGCRFSSIFSTAAPTPARFIHREGVYNRAGERSVTFCKEETLRNEQAVIFEIAAHDTQRASTRVRVPLFHKSKKTAKWQSFLIGGEGGTKTALLRCPKKSSGCRFSSIFSTAAPTPTRCIRHRRREQALPDTLRVPRVLFCSIKQERPPHKRRSFLFGRGRRARTLGTRFWRPLLYQLSYAPIRYIITAEAVIAWWAFRDSNPGPTGYEPVALTN